MSDMCTHMRRHTHAHISSIHLIYEHVLHHNNASIHACIPELWYASHGNTYTYYTYTSMLCILRKYRRVRCVTILQASRAILMAMVSSVSACPCPNSTVTSLVSTCNMLQRSRSSPGRVSRSEPPSPRNRPFLGIESERLGDYDT